MADVIAPAGRCGIDTVEIARIERLLATTTSDDLREVLSAEELEDGGAGPGRAASLAARFAAKEACVKLFPREAALGAIDPADFSVARDNYGAPRVVCGPRAAAVLGRHRIASIALSLTHDRVSASAVALAERANLKVPLAGRLMFHFFPLRRAIIVANLTRVYGNAISESDIVALAQAHYSHLLRLAGEFLRFRWLSAARKAALVRVENIDAFVAAQAMGRGVLVLTGHFGNWEVATIAGIANYPQVRGRFHFVRRAIKPNWLDTIVTRRFDKAGFGVIGKRGSLDRILDVLAAGDVIVFPFDQHRRRRTAWKLSLRSSRVTLQASRSSRSPRRARVSRNELAGRRRASRACGSASRWHPSRWKSTNEAIRENTRAYNAVLESLILDRPEQWYWVHRRWKAVAPRARKGRPLKP